MHLVRPMIIAELTTERILAQPLPRCGILWSSFGNRNMIPSPNPNASPPAVAACGSDTEQTSEGQGHEYRSVGKLLPAQREETHSREEATKEMEGETSDFNTHQQKYATKALLPRANAADSNGSSTSINDVSTDVPKTLKSKSNSAESPISCQLENESHQITPIWEFSDKDDFSMFCARYENK